MSNVKFIQIGFENMESIIIPIQRVKVNYASLTVHGKIIEGFKVNYPVYKTDMIKLEISFKNEDELLYDSQKEEAPLAMFINNPLSNHVEDRPHILGRVLNHSDIVNVEMLDENETIIECIYAPWGKGHNDYTNSYMTTHVENNLLTIHIEKP